ncbi:YIP1 family protein [Streptomyces sp. ACA25]|uniref:Yip1 family protein n=1 Tax=Streptomyces sp. ACA25 TaxID=3022596 RepID=UPI002307CCFC|nr:YIP1 family protein [Streptomyces sp. ACA25]MDB1086083.1 YIP1 family protein [Streptomyces sp. ACA25]
MAGFRKKREQGRPGAAPQYPAPGPAQGHPPREQYPPQDPYGAPYPPQHGQPPHGQPHHHGPGRYPGSSGYGGPAGYSEGTVHGGGGGPEEELSVPPGPRLSWKELLTGILVRPSPTFWQMRDYAVWGPALVVTFLYGLVAVFGLDNARDEILATTAANVVPYLLLTGVAMVVGALLLSTVTHTLARQFGGNGHWAPTVGLAMLIMTLTDVPRLALALFLGGAAMPVQVLGWATWAFAGVLFTMMVSRSHELPWPRALAASAMQLLALLMLVKLGTL